MYKMSQLRENHWGKINRREIKKDKIKKQIKLSTSDNAKTEGLLMQIELPQSLKPGLSFSHYSNDNGKIKAVRSLCWCCNKHGVKSGTKIIATHELKFGCVSHIL